MDLGAPVAAQRDQDGVLHRHRLWQRGAHRPRECSHPLCSCHADPFCALFPAGRRLTGVDLCAGCVAGSGSNILQVSGLNRLIETVNAEDKLLIIDDVFDTGAILPTFLLSPFDECLLTFESLLTQFRLASYLLLTFCGPLAHFWLTFGSLSPQATRSKRSSIRLTSSREEILRRSGPPACTTSRR